MEDWNDYLLILALHRAKTLRGAAIMLGTTHTTVARRLALLHKRRHAAVFEKSISGYIPTPLGQQLVAVAQQVENVVQSADRLEKTIGHELAGPIRLSLSEALVQYLLLDDLMRFKKLYPQISLTLDCNTKLVNLDRSEADVVVRAARTLPDHLVGRRLFPYTLSYYATHDYIEDTPHTEQCWIVPDNHSIWPEWLAESPFPDRPIGLVVNDIVTRFKALLSGVGMSRAACFMAEPHPDLVRLPQAKISAQPDLWVLTHPDLRDTPRIKLLMRFLVDALHAKRELIMTGI